MQNSSKKDKLLCSQHYCLTNFNEFIPRAQRERGKVIGCGVHIYVIVINQTRFYSQITSTEARGRIPRVEVLVA